MSADGTESWRLRPARDSDAAAVATTFRASFGLLDFIPTLHTPAQDLAFFTRVIETHRVIVAERNDEVLGFSSETNGWIDHLYVHPACLGLGIGSALLRQAQDRQERLALWCFQQNSRARTFYEAHGFIAVEFTDGSRNEEREPDVRYVWDPSATLTPAQETP